MNRILLITLLVAGVASCSRKDAAPEQPAQLHPSGQSPQVPLSAMPKIDPNAVLAHVKVLSSDEYEGRAPGTKGEDLSVKYIQDQFQKLNLKPGNPDGTYVQKVPLVGILGKEAKPLSFTKGSQKQTLKWADDVVAWTKHVADGASIDISDVVFAGYGVDAPE